MKTEQKLKKEIESLEENSEEWRKNEVVIDMLNIKRAKLQGYKLAKKEVLKLIDGVLDSDEEEICKYIVALKKGKCFKSKEKKEVINWLSKIMQIRIKLKQKIKNEK